MKPLKCPNCGSKFEVERIAIKIRQQPIEVVRKALTRGIQSAPLPITSIGESGPEIYACTISHPGLRPHRFQQTIETVRKGVGDDDGGIVTTEVLAKLVT